jgi:hypothetical protein
VRQVKHILSVVVILCVASTVGCDFLSTKAESGGNDSQGGQGAGAGGSAEKGKEAPELAQQVEAGDLSAVE